MPQADLSNGVLTLDTSLDRVTIIEMLENSPTGGVVLDTEGFALPIIKAGHIIIKSKTEARAYKPMPVNAGGTAYEALPGGYQYAGVLYTSVLRERPLASVMVRGSVNVVTSPFPVTDEMKTALPLIVFTQD